MRVARQSRFHRILAGSPSSDAKFFDDQPTGVPDALDRRH